jgi:hypothetical protein
MSWLSGLIAGLIPAALPAAQAQEVTYVDASLDLRGDLLDWRFLDLDGDGKVELCLALHLESGSREIHLHRTSAIRIEAEPYRKIHVLEDVIAHGWAEVREEPGLELLLLTRTGVFSYSPELPGYRGNARRLVETELLYDVPDPHALPYWDYALGGGERDLLLVPVRGGLELWGPGAGEARSDYQRRSRIPLQERGYVRPEDIRARASQRGSPRDLDNLAVRVDIDRDFGPFFAGALPGSGATSSPYFLSTGRSVPAPALMDVDRDGRLDLLVWQSPVLSIHLHDGHGFPAVPSRVERLPDYLQREGQRLTLRLVDLDGDGLLDVMAQLQRDDDRFENKDISLFLLRNDGKRFFPEQPSQLLRFEGGVLVPQVVDVDGDGRPDLFLRLFRLPNLVGTVTGLEFKLSTLLYLAERKGGRLFERTPAFKQERSYDENSVVEAAATRDLSHDCSGDGIPDLVEVDVQGNIAIRRLVRERGFLTGRTWKLEETPWKRFDVRGSIASLDVLDVNGDGLGDIVSLAGSRLRVLLSSRRGGAGGR